MGVCHWLHWKVDVENKAKGSADCWAERSAKCLSFLPGTAGAAAGLRLLPRGLGERPAPTGRSSEASAAGRQGAPQPVLSAAAELVTQADVTGSRGGRLTQKQLCVALEAPRPRPDKAAGSWGGRGSAPRRRGRERLDRGPGTSPPYTCQWPQATGPLMLAGDERLWRKECLLP